MVQCVVVWVLVCVAGIHMVSRARVHVNLLALATQSFILRHRLPFSNARGWNCHCMLPLVVL